MVKSKLQISLKIGVNPEQQVSAQNLKKHTFAKDQINVRSHFMPTNKPSLSLRQLKNFRSRISYFLLKFMFETKENVMDEHNTKQKSIQKSAWEAEPHPVAGFEHTLSSEKLEDPLQNHWPDLITPCQAALRFKLSILKSSHQTPNTY